MLTPSIGFCAMPSTTSGWLMLGRFEDRRHDVDDVVELLADAALVLDHLGPGDGHALLGAAEVRRHHLGPGERRVEGPGPGHRHVRIGQVRAPDVVEVLQLGLDRQLDTLDRGDLVRRADQAAFGAGAVVAADIDDQRIVELAHVLDRLDHAADLMVGVGHVGGEDLDLADEHLLLVGRELSHSFSRSLGHGVIFASGGITPSFF